MSVVNQRITLAKYSRCASQLNCSFNSLFCAALLLPLSATGGGRNATHHSSITTLHIAGWCAVNELVSRALFIGWFQYNAIGGTCQHRRIVIKYFQKTLDSDVAS